MANVISAVIVLLIQMSEAVCWYWFWGKIANPKEMRRKYRVAGLIGVFLFVFLILIMGNVWHKIKLLNYSMNNLSGFIFALYAILFYEITFTQASRYVMVMLTADIVTEYLVTLMLLPHLSVMFFLIIHKFSC